jgi:hypothetical protein
MEAVAAPILLTRDELVRVTGYRQPARQVAELRRQGYYRARRAPVTGEVILERAHYEAVCAGLEAAKNKRGGTSGPELLPA